jgi:hypothetical protein
MIKTVIFGVGERGGKFHSFMEAEGEPRLEGPARDTEAEALRDRDKGMQLSIYHFEKVGLRVSPVKGVQ